MSDQLPTRQIIVKDLVQIHKGKTRKGADYVIWQVRATKPDGQVIDGNLRTFEEFPRNEVITVTVEKFDSDQYGRSYTLKQVGRKSTRDELKELRERIDKLERAVYTPGQPAAAPPPTQPAPPVAPPPTPPPTPATTPPPVTPAENRVAGDEDIPF